MIHWLNRCRTVLFTSPKQHTPDGFLDSHAQSPSRMNLEIVSGTVVAPVSEISSRICFSSKPKRFREEFERGFIRINRYSSLSCP